MSKIERKRWIVAFQHHTEATQLSVYQSYDDFQEAAARFDELMAKGTSDQYYLLENVAVKKTYELVTQSQSTKQERVEDENN